MTHATRSRSARLRIYPVLAALSLVALALSPVAPSALALDGGLAAQPDPPPELDVITDEFAIPGVRFHITVAALGPVREVYAYAPGVSARRVRLRLDRETGFYQGYLPLPLALAADEITVRVVARDRARKRIQAAVRVPVLSDVCCEDEEERCGLLPQVIEAVEREASAHRPS